MYVGKDTHCHLNKQLKGGVLIIESCLLSQLYLFKIWLILFEYSFEFLF